MLNFLSQVMMLLTTPSLHISALQTVQSHSQSPLVFAFWNKTGVLFFCLFFPNMLAVKTRNEANLLHLVTTLAMG